MPPINQQRSATGLVVALVAFVILFVVSAIFAMSYSNQLKRAVGDIKVLQESYASLIPEGSMKSETVTALTAAKSSDPRFNVVSSDPIIEVAAKQTAGVANEIVGSSVGKTPAQVVDAGIAAVRDAQKALDENKINDPSPDSPNKVTLDTGNLTLVIKTLTDKVVSEHADLVTANAKYDAEVTSHQADKDAVAAASSKFTADLTKSQNDDKAIEETTKKSADDSASTLAEVQKTQAGMIADAKTMADTMTAKEAESKKESDKNKLQVAAFEERLGRRRPDSSKNIVAQADGKIIRAAGKDVCYINIGEHMQVSPGLTFEVYDRATGVPPIPPNVSGDEQLPVGKASIEVTKVGPISSECRIVHLEPGAVLSEGDLIANLVYDPNTKYKFFVYGDFDMGQSGRPSAGDADVIRRLITQWGGTITDKIDVNTDFVVLGAEPVLPTFTHDEMQDPLNVDKANKAQAALDEYANKRQMAIELHIPVMNQNRFLYYVGFYDQAKR
jgi:hypothetical protein